MSNSTLHNQISQFLKRNRLLKPGAKVLLAVSGGADSMAMLHAFYKLSTTVSFHLHTCHINHHLRDDAKLDTELVEQTCRQLNIPCSVYHRPIQMNAHAKMSIEERARASRLKTLGECAQKMSCDFIALAHHQEDLAETVMMRILRGTGLMGLQAILPLRHMMGSTWIRPLLTCTRKEIDQYIKAHKIRYRTDSTNKESIFFRNKIRNQLLPYLRKHYQPQLTSILNHLAITASEDYAFIRSYAQKRFSKIVVSSRSTSKIVLNIKPLRKQPVAIQRTILRMAFEQLLGSTLSLSMTKILQIESFLSDTSTRSLKLDKKFTITRNHDKLKISRLS